MSDAELLERLMAGDRAAMRAIFTAHHLRVFRFVVRLVEREDVAEDVVTEVFLDLWRQAGQFEQRSSLSTWLLVIARNKAYSSLRRRKEEQLDDGVAEALPDQDDSPEISAQKMNKAAIMRQCLDKLSPEHRMVMDLVYYHEEPIEAVSRILGIPENTVKTRMFHARKRLSELCKAAGLDRGWP
ncbi:MULTISPECIES: sigma-70 family RNA polymerase sigma factor [unclassified Chelatococcus]|uniref:sigma-70 family RNA polymerase sigma factor n=1 Tax=unclassified Chelatococcus TaxID=2638111 RepID=UPI0020BFDA09|nr:MULTISPECIES: sigma-70 family RNA polymerase sigma factor [unclassified Chelatococcus]